MSETLSLDDAVSLLGSSPEPDETPAEAAPVEAAKPDEAPIEGETEIEAPPEAESDDGAETPTEVEAEQEPETVIEAPHFWSAEKKAQFATLDPELQQYILDSDKQAQRTVSQKLEEAATARKAADAEAQTFTQLAERITEAADQAEAVVADRWGNATPEDWLRMAKEMDPAAYNQLRARYEADQQAVQRAKAAKDAADTVKQERWLAEETERLKTYAPELADPVKGPANKKAVAEYLISQGATEQDLDGISAAVSALAYKAMLYDKGVAGLKSRPTPTKPALKPTAPAGKTLSQSEAETAARRLGQTGDVDDAVRLMQLRRKSG